MHKGRRYEGEAEDLGLTFSVEDDIFGRRQVHELCPGGDDVAVTSANKLLYVHLVADWHLNRRLGKPATSFASGLNQVGRHACVCVKLPSLLLALLRLRLRQQCATRLCPRLSVMLLHLRQLQKLSEATLNMSKISIGIQPILLLSLSHICVIKQVISSAWLRLFNPKEVNELLSGGEGGGMDAEDMRAHAIYSGGYGPDSSTVKLFWKVGSFPLQGLWHPILLQG